MLECAVLVALYPFVLGFGCVCPRAIIGTLQLGTMFSLAVSMLLLINKRQVHSTT